MSENYLGTTIRLTISGRLQHEIDHLNAILLVDHMSAVQRVANSGKLKRLKKGILPR